MGRGKVEIKRIESSTNRQVTFSKRRNGIIKKSREISVLCEAQVSVIIFSSSGKLSEYCTPSTSLSNIVERYQTSSGMKLWDTKHEDLNAEIERIKKQNDKMQIELRHLKGEDLNSLQPKELIPLEDALENGLAAIRDKQMEILKSYEDIERMLEEENNRLALGLHRMHLMDETATELEYASQMPFALRVLPNQQQNNFG